MCKLVGCICVLGGVTGVLYDWIMTQKLIENRIEEFLQFIHKSIFVMETENIRIINLFMEYQTSDDLLEKSLHSIGNSLNEKRYPTGQEVWRAVFMDIRQELGFDEELFQCILHVANGFFGRSKQENISYLKRYFIEIERMQKQRKEKSKQERKVWIPIGVLGGVMTIILFI